MLELLAGQPEAEQANRPCHHQRSQQHLGNPGFTDQQQPEQRRQVGKAAEQGQSQQRQRLRIKACRNCLQRDS